jgi:GT2 family glycosyltransferase
MTPAILLPVYNAASALSRCLAALDRTLPSGYPVFLSDDASPDPAVAQLLDDWTRRTVLSVTLQRQPVNLGFVGNVNDAMQRLGSIDVILLNSDTCPVPGWIDGFRRCLDADPRIATATPWSNNAEICSFPQLCQAAPMPGPEALVALGAAAATLVDEPPPELPTGVGFAMAVRGQAWRELGGFDVETFGRGYGEENDFCLRAAAHGWRNVLCPGAYVAHQGHASFADTGHAPGGENLRRLLARYPDYNERVAAFICRDPLRELRERFSERLAAVSGTLP